MENLTNRFIPICINEKAMCKMQYYCEYASDEVGGVLEIDCTKKAIKIKDVIIIEQEASGGDFYLDDEALAKYTEAIFIKKPDKMKHIKGWWHKHPISGWSGHDDDTFKKLREYFKGFVFGVVMRDIHKNKKNKFSPLCRLEVGRGDLDEGKTQIIQFHTPHLKVIKNRRKFDKRKLRKKCKKEVEKLVKEKKIIMTSYNGYYGGYTPYQGHQNRDTYDEEFNRNRETEEPATDESTARILNKAGLVWDSELGYYVHKDYYKGKKEKQTVLTGNREAQIGEYGDRIIEDEDGVFWIWIGNEKYNIKREIDCSFTKIHCTNCPYQEDCIEHLENNGRDKTEQDYLDYMV